MNFHIEGSTKLYDEFLKIKNENGNNPRINGVEDHRQRFKIKKDQIPTLFTPKFEEHRELLDHDYRKFYGYIYNEHYDDIIKNKRYEFGFNIKTNKFIQYVLTQQND